MLIFTELHQMEILKLSGGLGTKKFHFLDIYVFNKLPDKNFRQNYDGHVSDDNKIFWENIFLKFEARFRRK